MVGAWRPLLATGRNLQHAGRQFPSLGFLRRFSCPVGAVPTVASKIGSRSDGKFLHIGIWDSARQTETPEPFFTHVPPDPS